MLPIQWSTPHTPYNRSLIPLSLSLYNHSIYVIYHYIIYASLFGTSLLYITFVHHFCTSFLYITFFLVHYFSTSFFFCTEDSYRCIFFLHQLNLFFLLLFTNIYIYQPKKQTQQNLPIKRHKLKDELASFFSFYYYYIFFVIQGKINILFRTFLVWIIFNF